MAKKEPQLNKSMDEKMGEAKDGQEDVACLAAPQGFKEKPNGSVTEHKRDEATEKAEFKASSNDQMHAKKRARSRSRSHSPTDFPERKDSGSPMRRAHSGSSSLSPLHKAAKLQRFEDWHAETRDSHLPRSHYRSGDMAPQIKQLYKYQEEIQQRKNSWDKFTDFPPLQSPSAQPHPHEGMDPAGQSYYEHNSKLRFKQSARHLPLPHKYNRTPQDRPSECHVINKSIHYSTKSFSKRGDHRQTKRSEVRFWSGGVSGSRSRILQQGERGWNSPLTEQQRYNNCEVQRFEAPHHFNNRDPAPGLGHGPAPMGFQQQPSRFNGPLRFDAPRYVEGPGHPGPQNGVPYQGGPLHFENFPGQQSHLRFDPRHNLRPSMRPIGPPIYKNSMVPEQNFPMASQCFPEPINPQFPTLSVAVPGQQNIQQVGNFNMQPNFSQPGPATFYNPAAPAIGPQQPVMGNMNQPFLPQNPVPFPQQNPQVSPPVNQLSQIHMKDLVPILITMGIIKPLQPEAAPTSSSKSSSVPPAAPLVEKEKEKEREVEEEDIPDLTSFSIDKLSKRYESVVTELYSGKQCSQCSKRFKDTEINMYCDHLDSHVMGNRTKKEAGKEAGKKGLHRSWYYSAKEWVKLEDSNLEDASFFKKENEKRLQKKEVKEVQRTRATKGQVKEYCEICQEPFETYWVHEEEDWFLKNAIKVNDKNFHPMCFEDSDKNMPL